MVEGANALKSAFKGNLGHGAMKKYTTLMIEVIELENADILTLSGADALAEHDDETPAPIGWFTFKF